MERDDTALYLSRIALGATKNTDAGRKLDWFICRQIRYWEECHAQELADRGLRPAFAIFDARHWDEICYLVRARLLWHLFHEVPPHVLPTFDEDPRQLDTQNQALAFLLEEFLKETTEAVCRERLRKLLGELEELKLPAYLPRRAEADGDTEGNERR